MTDCVADGGSRMGGRQQQDDRIHSVEEQDGERERICVREVREREREK